MSETMLTKGERLTNSNASRGLLIARLLAGAWRASPPQPTTSSLELEQLAPLLLNSGAGALAWCKLRHSELSCSAVADQLHQAYRLQSLQAALHERSLKQVISLLRGIGVEPMLVKGWSIARIYPEAAMRPYCDLDLCVLPDHYKKASDALKSIEGLVTNVDLHAGFGKFYDRRTDDIFARSQLVKLDDIGVRILCDEDNIRYLCMHVLRHGAVRPLWLCDIAVALESRTCEFDWDRCLAGSRREADWVSCAIRLASFLLGVDIEGTPVAHRGRKLPSWLVKAVTRDWGISFRSPRQVHAMLRQPLRLLDELPKELLRHWPNPIEATMTLRGPFNRLPRLPFQVGHVVSRTFALISEMIGMSRVIQHRS
ncbi:MAG: nucleotidyltransferase family protein [Acidobacteriota bacterium]